VNFWARKPAESPSSSEGKGDLGGSDKSMDWGDVTDDNDAEAEGLYCKGFSDDHE
jgi:hypothetical protein